MNVYSLINGIRALSVKNPYVMWLRSKEYSPLGLQAIRTLLAKQKQLYPLSLEDSQSEHVKAQCSTFFLGQSYSYYLGDISKYLKQKNSSWLSYIAHYQGPHTLIFWADATSVQEVPASWFVLDIPEVVDAKTAGELVTALYPEHKKNMDILLNTLFKTTPTVSFESFCRLGMYAAVVGNQYDDFMQEYASGLITTDSSLFLLSQHLLGKKSGDFYKHWVAISKQYPTVFWISFWADQFWRATLFVRYMHTNKRPLAYDIAKSKLPFSFTKTDWVRANPDLLQKQYMNMCDFDFFLKNGGDEVWLELLLSRWFSA